MLDETDPLARQPWLAVADMTGSGPDLRITLAARIAEEDALALGDVEQKDEAWFDPATGRVRARRTRRMGAIVLDETPLPSPSPELVRNGLLQAVRGKGFGILGGHEQLAQLLARVSLLAGAMGSPWPANLQQVLFDRLDEWLGPLVENAALSSASTGYSQRMVAQGFFAHESPDGGTLVDRLTAAGYLGDDDAWVVGENIGWGQASLATPRSMVDAWMNSPGHRENLLSADYSEVGLGLALGTPADQTWGATYTTDFGAGSTARAAAVSPRAKKSAPRRKAARATSCARDASARRSARSAKARRSSACSRTARMRRR